MRRTATGEEASFSTEEVARFKTERDALTTTVTSATNVSEVVRDAPTQALQRAGNGMSVEALELITTRLSETFEESPFAQEMRELAKRMTNALEAIQAQGSASSEADSLPLEEKLTLSIDDAARLSGLSANHIYAAVRAGKLKGKIVGRGWRIKPDALKAYVARVLKA